PALKAVACLFPQRAWDTVDVPRVPVSRPSSLGSAFPQDLVQSAATGWLDLIARPAPWCSRIAPAHCPRHRSGPTTSYRRRGNRVGDHTHANDFDLDDIAFSKLADPSWRTRRDEIAGFELHDVGNVRHNHGDGERHVSG